MEIDTDTMMETPKSSSFDVDMTSTSHGTNTTAAVFDGELSRLHAATRHAVPSSEPSTIAQRPHTSSVKPEHTAVLGSTKFKATNSPLHMSFAQQHGSEADSPSLKTRTDEGTPYENDSAAESKSSEEPALSAADEPAELTPAAEDDTPAINELDSDALDVPSADDDDNLSPPPESIDDQILEDQIVVAKGKTADASVSANPLAAVADVDAMDEDDDDEDLIKSSRHPKRKRHSLYEDLAEEKMDSTLISNADEDGTLASTPTSEIMQNGIPVATKEVAKPIILGYWRESDAPSPDQHVVKGFIDSRDRLRTRIQTHNRAGDTITGKYPLKPGPGGSWVTFHNIIFDDHLVHLDQLQVKEYVKVRAGFTDNNAEEKTANDKIAVKKAIQASLNRAAPAENSLPPLIAYGAQIPDHARISYSRAEKRRRTAAANGQQATPDFQPPPPPHRLQAGPGPVFAQPIAHGPPIPPELAGKRPTKIMLGYWLESAEPKLEDKHAVFGILGNNDMFRVKVGRETRDGRPMQSNFPQGAGALWINAHQWKKEEYLEDLSREELKEYCRLRQWQLDQGEHQSVTNDNIRYAVHEARRRAAYFGNNKKNTSNHVLPANNHFTDAVLTHEIPHETRQTIRRSGPPALTSATTFNHDQGPMSAGFRAANRGPYVPHPHNADPRLERANNLATHAVSRIEANQAKVEERDAHVLHAPPFPLSNGHDNAPNGHHGQLGQNGQNGQGGDEFREHLGRLNTVWSQQEAQRIRSGNEDAKIHLGTKYERKATGPFAGKLVSQGNIISIDGEDYVEYRVLTKPSFI